MPTLQVTICVFGQKYAKNTSPAEKSPKVHLMCSSRFSKPGGVYQGMRFVTYLLLSVRQCGRIIRNTVGQVVQSGYLIVRQKNT